ncbi:MAG: hypothetical protein U1F43_28490 [Myxococcota bacterium]
MSAASHGAPAAPASGLWARLASASPSRFRPGSCASTARPAVDSVACSRRRSSSVACLASVARPASLSAQWSHTKTRSDSSASRRATTVSVTPGPDRNSASSQGMRHRLSSCDPARLVSRRSSQRTSCITSTRPNGREPMS